MYFDDTENTDEFQREVYGRAVQIMDAEAMQTVYDIGCGSGFKLIEYMGNFDTVGFDVPETVVFLQNRYPTRKWRSLNLNDVAAPPDPRPDLVICADVIEHVLDPDQLIETILTINPRLAIFSTPDRELLYWPDDRRRFGPPGNRSHIREWNFSEFGRYISRRFDIVDHVITNADQGTQMIVCKPRKI